MSNNINITPEQMIELTQGTITALGGDWIISDSQIDMNRRITDLERADGLSIRLIFDGWKSLGRVNVIGIWREYPNGHSYSPEDASSISVAYNRGAVIIAREIKRRFLPKYEPLHFKYESARLAFILKKHTRRAMMVTARHIVGDGRMTTDPNNNDQLRLLAGRFDDRHLQVSYCTHHDGYEINLTAVPPSLASAIMELYRSHRESPPPPTHHQVALI